MGLAVGGWGEGEAVYPNAIFFIEGFLLCAFFGLRSITPSRCTYATANRQNSFAPHLNGKPSSLPITYIYAKARPQGVSLCNHHREKRWS
ncbi:hypothetical protein HZH66_014972 [Vespula vulgaris]|uniref:Uncharacterized protein n=1 Tax=Vespula vulgaris TaxID=7454 RepID=A0A834J1L2_VESVU|nr:hypothetical protein HZH66_014972 [Vespula vulgaris]